MLGFAAPAYRAMAQEIDGPEELVLAVVVDNALISKGASAYAYGDEYYFSLQELASLFKFYIDPASNSEKLFGYGGSEANSFEINVAENKIIKRSEEIVADYPLFLDNVQGGVQGVYINKKALEALWDFTSVVEISGLSVRIQTAKPLPFQIVDAQNKARKKLLSRYRGIDDEKVLPFIATPYKAIGMPTIDINARAGFDAIDDVGEGNLSVSGVQDLLWASADYSVQLRHQDGQFDAPDNLRFRLTRENIHEGALPFDLERVQLGDVSQRNRELIGRTLSGRGVTLTNDKKFQNLSVNPIRIEEQGVPGYEVELYRNNELIDTGVVGQDGLYRFEDLELFYGQNDVQLIFYGPQGQVKEVDKSFVINKDIVPVGRTQYSFTALKSERELFEIDEENEPQPKGLASNLQVAHGITSNASIFGSLNSVPTRMGTIDETKKYATAGFDISALNALTRIEGYKQFDGGTAAELTSLTSLYDFKVNFKLALFNDFESTEAGITNQKDREAEIQARRNFATGLGALGLNLRSEYTEFENGSDRLQTNFRQSLNTGSNRLTNNVTVTQSSTADTTMTGQISNLTRFTNTFRMRNGFNYMIQPEAEVQTAFSEFRYDKNDYLSVLRADYNFIDHEKRVGVTVSKDYQKFLLGVDTQWSSNYGVSAFLRLSTSFGPYGPENEYILNSKPLSSVGPVVANVFYDKNYDGIYNEEDEPLENARIGLGERIIRDATDESGDLLVLQPPRGVMQTSIMASSIEDPYKKPANEGYEILPRPGTVQHVPLPVVDTGAIDGTVYNPATGQVVADLEIMAIDMATNKIVKITKTGYDGYYTLEFLKPGTYKLQTKPLEGVGYFEKEVTISQDNLYNSGVNFAEAELKQTDLFSLLKQAEGALSQVLAN